MRTLYLSFLTAALFVLTATGALAHTPLCSCWDNGDGTITCEGGFSDGSSAAGVDMYILQNGNKVISGEMDDFSEFTFEEPGGNYTVVFDAGKGHKVKIKGNEIY
ncbi:hypothetical protein [Desulfovermiculus halophilus]|uniref:hypothetical protein n=1 Tax=Desulfovermiculus halophilus TaxID=339722 RepID=UPI0004891FCB|nr:hypothetical protein [Desulfovermiculus halophilus]